MTGIDDRDWEQLYREQVAENMPWYYEHLDHDFQTALEKYGIGSGRALDLGTGPGTQAIALAKAGLTVTGTDISRTAVRQAAQLAAAQGVAVDFITDNILDSKLAADFDYVFDRGCFHVIPPDDRHVYIETVRELIVPTGMLFLKCFSRNEPGSGGPYRFTPEMIEGYFGGDFDVLSAVESEFQGNRKPVPKALFSVMRRR